MFGTSFGPGLLTFSFHLIDPARLSSFVHRCTPGEKRGVLLNVEQRERGNPRITVPLPVDGGLLEDTRRKVTQTIVSLQRCGAQSIERYFTLYEIPDEGYELCLVESIYTAPGVVSRPKEGHTTRVIYSEEEARRYYPMVLEQLLRQKQVKEKGSL